MALVSLSQLSNFLGSYMATEHSNTTKKVFAYLQPTRRCNQKCVICSYPAFEKSASLEEVKNQIKLFKKQGAFGIIFTGGEPTLYPELPEAIEYCVSEGLEAKLTTNGQIMADEGYTKRLAEAGLQNINISLYSNKDEVQEQMTQTPGSLKNILKAIENVIKHIGFLSMNLTITSMNFDHLSETVRFLCGRYPEIHHYVFNYILITGCVKENTSTVPRLVLVEPHIKRTAQILKKYGKTFRMERVPLCYMDGFEDCSTETRILVKDQPYLLYLLRETEVERGKVQGSSIKHDYVKPERCSVCFLEKICAGLEPRYAALYGTGEVFPSFKKVDKIIYRIQA